MAAGTVKYTKPEYGDLAGALGEKIGSAISMAAGARKSQNEEIKKLQNIPEKERTEEQQERLEELLKQKESQGKRYFFTKALGAEFGGDRIRRTIGFFQRDPKDYRDPALDKKKRFEALLAAQPAGVDRVSPTVPGETAPKGTGGALGSIGTGIIEKISILGAKVDSLKSIIVGDKNPVIVERLSKSVREIGKFFAKNNSYDEQELKISQEQLETQIKAAEDAKEQKIEDRGEKQKGNTGLASIDNERDGKKKKGIFSRIVDSVLDNISDGPGRRRRRGGKRRFGRLRSLGGRARRKGGNLLGRFRGGRRRKVGGIKPSSISPRTQYTSEIGPLPMKSSEPWAAKGPGDRGGIFGQEGFTPRLQSSPKKLASGGVLNPVPNKLASGGFLDNPTNVAGPAAAVPKNKLATAVKQNPENVKKATPFAKALQLPTMAAGSILFSTVANVLGGMGGVARLFRPVIQRIFSPAAAVFGLPVNLISALFGGGPAAAATLDTSLFGGGKSKKDKKKKGGGGGASPAAPMTPGANLAGTSVAREVDLAGNTHSEVGFTSGFGLRGSPGGVGSTNHRGVDIGTSGKRGYYVAMRRSGTVVHNKSMDGGAGNWVGIKTDDGVEYRFMHLAQPSPLKVGQTYTGQTIGEIGNTGASTGEHLHFEKIVNGSHVDPKADAAALLDIGKTLNPMNAPPTIAQPQSPGAPATPAPAGTPAALQQMMAPTTPIVIPGAPAPRALSSTGPLESPWPVVNPENPFAPTPF